MERKQIHQELLNRVTDFNLIDLPTQHNLLSQLTIMFREQSEQMCPSECKGVTEVVNQANNGNRIQLTLVDDKVFMQIGSEQYEFKLSFLKKKIDRHLQFPKVGENA